MLHSKVDSSACAHWMRGHVECALDRTVSHRSECKSMSRRVNAMQTHSMCTHPRACSHGTGTVFGGTFHASFVMVVSARISISLECLWPQLRRTLYVCHHVSRQCVFFRHVLPSFECVLPLSASICNLRSIFQFMDTDVHAIQTIETRFIIDIVDARCQKACRDGVGQ